MTESKWLSCTDPEPMLEFLKGKTSDRKLRLFAVACCRKMWKWKTLGTDYQKAVHTAEAFPDGDVELASLMAARTGVEFGIDKPERVAFLTSHPRFDRPSILFRYGAIEMTHLDEDTDKRLETICLSGESFPAEVAEIIVRDSASNNEDSNVQACILRDIFGPLPFRLIIIDQSWLSWNDGTVPKIARQIYDNRTFDELSVLGDALEESGYCNQEVLSHCREPGPHVRGCWVLDLVLGKE